VSPTPTGVPSVEITPPRSFCRALLSGKPPFLYSAVFRMATFSISYVFVLTYLQTVRWFSCGSVHEDVTPGVHPPLQLHLFSHICDTLVFDAVVVQILAQHTTSPLHTNTAESFNRSEFVNKCQRSLAFYFLCRRRLLRWREVAPSKQTNSQFL
jgi:hypothetical protein